LIPNGEVWFLLDAAHPALTPQTPMSKAAG
jgi:hypothetical protein